MTYRDLLTQQASLNSSSIEGYSLPRSLLQHHHIIQYGSPCLRVWVQLKPPSFGEKEKILT